MKMFWVARGRLNKNRKKNYKTHRLSAFSYLVRCASSFVSVCVFYLVVGWKESWLGSQANSVIACIAKAAGPCEKSKNLTATTFSFQAFKAEIEFLLFKNKFQSSSCRRTTWKISPLSNAQASDVCGHFSHLPPRHPSQHTRPKTKSESIVASKEIINPLRRLS